MKYIHNNVGLTSLVQQRYNHANKKNLFTPETNRWSFIFTIFLDRISTVHFFFTIIL